MDYTKGKDELKLPNLSKLQMEKLKQLTIVELGATNRIVPFALLMSSLDIENQKELDSIIIASIYKNLIKGKLNPRMEQFEVSWVCGRDFRVTELDSLINRVDEWEVNTLNVLMNSKHQLDEGRKNLDSAKKGLIHHSKHVEKRMNTLKKKVDLDVSSAGAGTGSRNDGTAGDSDINWGIGM